MTDVRQTTDAFTVSALQIGTSPDGTAATLAHILSYEDEIIASRSRLVVLPEAILGGYPKGSSFGTRVGYRLPEGRDEFTRYYQQAIALPGPELSALEGLSSRTGAELVVGVIERSGSTLYCTALFIDPNVGLIDLHRKILPTASERLIWGQGDASTMPVVRSAAGRLGAAICWENYVPLFRTAMYAKDVQIWCAPTVDDRDVWQSTMRHIALEGRCFVVSACQYVPSPATLGRPATGWPDDRDYIDGGSVIVGPLGDILVEPLRHAEGLVSATINLKELIGARYDLDPVGHYSRPDLFTLAVDETPRQGVEFTHDLTGLTG